MEKDNMEKAIWVEGLTKNYNNVKALRGIDLQVARGEFFGLVGPDGAGKTTLIKILVGILKFNKGKALILNKDLKKNLDDIRLKIGYVSQNFNLYLDLTVEENINFYSQIYSNKLDLNFKEKMLDFIGLKPFRNRLASNLSGGMKQKLSLLANLIHKPKLLFLDEPTTGVDPVSRRDFWQIVFHLQKEDLTVLASTPYMDEAEQFDRIALISKGKFIRKGTTQEIKNSIPGEVIEIICTSPPRAREVLKKLPIIDDVELFGDKIHVFVQEANNSIYKEIKENLSKHSIKYTNINKIPYSIEDVFIKVEAIE